MKKLFDILLQIIGWFMAFFFIILALSISGEPKIYFLACVILACPLFKKAFPEIHLWIRIAAIVILFIIAIFRTESDTEPNYTLQPSNKESNGSPDDNSSIENTTELENITEPSDNANSVIEENIQENVPNSSNSEADFKASCIEVDYNDLDDTWIGKNVTKEILFTSSDKESYTCGATESYVEDFDDFQKTYNIYEINDCRYDKSFIIQENDVIRIYGTITKIHVNYANGLDYPVIQMYYADYIRKWQHQIDSSKTIEEITEERIQEKIKAEKENEYYASLNSDYSGVTKNIDNMDSLSVDEFKSHCDAMNYKNMITSTEDLTGRYVKIHIQLTSHKVFTSEDAKSRQLGTLSDLYAIDDNVWYGRIFCEQTDDYPSGNISIVYFANNSTFDVGNLKKNENLIIYGRIVNYKVNDGYNNEFDILTIYIE